MYCVGNRIPISRYYTVFRVVRNSDRPVLRCPISVGMMDFSLAISSQRLIHEVSFCFIERCDSVRHVPGSVLGLKLSIQAKCEIATPKQGTISSIPILSSHPPPGLPATRATHSAKQRNGTPNRESPRRIGSCHAFSVWGQEIRASEMWPIPDPEDGGSTFLRNFGRRILLNYRKQRPL
jgi:hypothetical protein